MKLEWIGKSLGCENAYKVKLGIDGEIWMLKISAIDLELLVVMDKREAEVGDQ